MISEYLVDPDVINSWQRVQIILENMGVQNGRVIAKFPPDISERIKQLVKSYAPLESQGMIEKMRSIKPMFVSDKQFSHSPADWMKSALSLRQLFSNRFRAILSEHNPTSDKGIITPNDIFSMHPLWSVKRDDKCLKTEDEFRKYLFPLIKISNKVGVVDRNINVKQERYEKGLKCLIEMAYTDGSVKDFQVHTTIHFNDPSHGTVGISQICSDFHSKLSRHIPRGIQVKLVLWKELVVGKIHYRLLLSEKGGIRVCSGFDLDLKSNRNIQTDITLLGSEIHQERRNMFIENLNVGDSHDYECVHIEYIDGTK